MMMPALQSLAILFFIPSVPQIASADVRGNLVAWQPLSVTFTGPELSEAGDDPNPFLDYRLQVVFKSPAGVTYNVPGYFDGNLAGNQGDSVWRAMFTPDQPGVWTYKVSFRTGDNVAVSLQADAGEAASFDGQQGSLTVAQRDPNARGFLKWGRLEYVGGHYLKFRDGPYWIRGGVDSPENFLAYAGFDNTPASHRYAVHLEDWNPGDPDWADDQGNDGQGKAIIGAINSLSSQQVNSLYFLTMNIGGDGGDVWPWTGRPPRKGDSSDDNLHFDVSKLAQWETVFSHAQQSGVNLHFVLNEAESENKRELDDGELGIERKLYYRELIARFGHHNALSWNLCEEYNVLFDLGPERIRAFADYIAAIDPYDHPITVHSAHDPLVALRFTFGDPRFGLTSIQLNQRRIDTLVEQLREATAAAGHPLPVSMDEFTIDVGQGASWKPVNRSDLHRQQKLWPTLLSGGQIEFILEELLGTESFKTPELKALWRSVAIARTFMQDHLPFWEMSPDDALVDGSATITVGLGSGKSFQLGAQVFAKPDTVYAVYFPIATQTGRLDLSGGDGEFEARWFNPRSGEFEDSRQLHSGGDWIQIGSPPSDLNQDWVLLVKRLPN